MKEVAKHLLCQRVQESCEKSASKDQEVSDPANVRHVVDMLGALMDNFPLGEQYVLSSCTCAMFSMCLYCMLLCVNSMDIPGVQVES